MTTRARAYLVVCYRAYRRDGWSAAESLEMARAALARAEEAQAHAESL